MRQVIGQCAAVLSGEAGLASFLRRNLLGQMGLGGPVTRRPVRPTPVITAWSVEPVASNSSRILVRMNTS